jgi:hypothetical protein
VDRIGGPKALMMFATAIEAGAVLLLLFRSTKTPLARLAILPLAIFFVHVDAIDLSARGQVFGDLGLVIELGILARLRDSKRVPLILVFLHAALWTNLHLSFVAAVVLPLVAAGCIFIEERQSERLRPFLLTSLVAALGTLATPYGPKYLRLALGTAFDRSTTTLDLFTSPDFHDPLWLIAPAIGLVLVTFHRKKPATILFLLFFILAACRSRRFATALVAVEIGIAGPLIEDALIKVKKRRPFVQEALALAFTIAGIVWLGAFDKEAKDPFRDVPVKTTALARKVYEERVVRHESFTRVVEPLHWGGYFAHEWMGNPKYFIDGRDHLALFGNGAFDDSSALWNGAANALEILDIYEAGVVLWERGRPLDVQLRQSPSWVLVTENALAVVYERAASPTSRSRPGSP